MARTPNDDRSDSKNLQTPAGQAAAANHEKQAQGGEKGASHEKKPGVETSARARRAGKV